MKTRLSRATPPAAKPPATAPAKVNPTSRIGKLAAGLLSLEEEARAKTVKSVHALYSHFRIHWELLLDAMDGCGGFLNGDYLWMFPREDGNRFEERKKQARYHNYVESLVEIYVRYLFGRGVQRTTTHAGLQAFWDDVDGSKTKITDYLKTQTALALATGHVGILMDKPAAAPAGPSKADEKAAAIVPFLRAYTPVAILDWRTTFDTLVSVKLGECKESDDLLATQTDDDKTYLFWTTDGWMRTDGTGAVLEVAETQLGLIPMQVLRAKRSRRYPFLGKALVNPSLIRALYNRGSEEDDVLRNQAFSVFTVSLPKDSTAADVELSKNTLGGNIGTTQALVVIGEGDYKTPDMAVPETIRDNQLWLIQEIYRMAHMRYQRDSLTAESAEAIRLQHTELNEFLVGLAGELTELEMQLAKFFFYWTEPTPQAAEAALEAAEVNIAYPKEFFLRELAADLNDWAQAVRLGLGDTFTKYLKKQAVRRMYPDLDETTLKTIDDEIDAMKADANAGSAADELLQRARARFGLPANDPSKAVA